ncbi:MAG: hypothetical protein MZV65_22110 [Chromatiales bacterium]|nr:hypothetical protein [Chromatiales bacterium]
MTHRSPRPTASSAHPRRAKSCGPASTSEVPLELGRRQWRRPVTETWAQAAHLARDWPWSATLLSIWLRVATALSEIVVGTIAQLLIGALARRGAAGGRCEPGSSSSSGAGAILLTFLAGAELDPVVLRRQVEARPAAIGLVSFAAPFLGCAALARWVLGWSRAGELAGRHRACPPPRWPWSTR